MFARMAILLGLVLASIIGANTALAGELIYEESCRTAALKPSEYSSLIADRFAGLTCEDVRRYKEDLELISMALVPVEVALRSPDAQAMIAEELTRLGLTLANPPVLTVTVLGAVGVTTVYFLLKREMKECENEERAQLRDEILHDLKTSLGIKSIQPPELVIQH